MRIENTQVFGFEASIIAMRNPLDSWSKSDSICTRAVYDDTFYWSKDNANDEGFVLGEADKILSQKLAQAGNEHSKHLRMIQVWADLILPRFIWQEFDTYRHVEKISCSTMHRLMSKPITTDMFEEDVIADTTLERLNVLVDAYRLAHDSETKKVIKYHTKCMLPESFLQKRTINTNYQCLLNMYNQRKNHELPQWHEICKWILSLPYFKELTGLEGE